MKTEVEIEYNGKLPSVNHMYGRNPWGSVYLKPEGKAIKQQIAWTTKEKLPKDVEIGYQLVIRGQWYNGATSKTKIKKRDSNNLVKLIVDACCEALEIDDSQIFQEQVTKLHSGKEGFSVKFFVLTDENRLD